MKIFQATCLFALSIFLALGPERGSAGETPENGNAGFCRSYQLHGIGLVVGLQNTGDSFQSSPFAKVITQANLARFKGQAVNPSIYDGKVATVTVFAKLQTCSDKGKLNFLDKVLDLSLDPIGDATSLQGGALLITHLFGPDGQTYAFGQGVLSSCPDARESRAKCVPQGGLVDR
jgi:flagellar P-ring protein precursor FlgI